MTKKKKRNQYQHYGNLGKVFNFTRDDLNANRQGFITVGQKLGLNMFDRKYIMWIYQFYPFKWWVSKHRKAVKVTGKIRKQYSNRIISSGGNDTDYAMVLEKRQLSIDSGNKVVSFLLPIKQYNAIPELPNVTLYYDPDEHRILSVEPPYDQS
ncbi:MAG: hypothetical protein AAF846_19100 [Chloroflexota bacterium]